MFPVSLLRVVCGLLMSIVPVTVFAQLTPATAAREDTFLHTIEPGDTLIALARQLLAEPREWTLIGRLNKVRNPRRLVPGRTLAFPIDRMRSLPGSAQVLWVRGAPRVETPGAGSVLALLGATLTAGSTVVTAAGDSVRLQLSTGSTVTVGGQARMTLVEVRTLAGANVKRTRIDVQRGRIETTVPPATHPAQRDEIRTPVVTTTVRGTAFRVGVDEDATAASTEVLEGVVGVTRDREDVAVMAGFGTRARQGVPLDQPRALLPQPDLTAQSTPVTRLPVRVRWPAVAGAMSYRVRMARAGDEPPLEERQVPSAEASWADLADGTYQFAVRAIDGEGLEGFEATGSVVVDARPVPPLIQDGGDGVTYGDQVTLRWTRPEGVEAFDLQVASDEGFGALRYERAGLTALEATVPLDPGRYVWRVASRAGSERGPWSDPRPVELRPRPAAGPPPDALVQKGAITLRWSGGVPGDRYVVQVSADPSFGATILDAEVREATVTIPRPAAGRYHVRVRIVNAEGVSGPFGPTQTLDVPRPPRSKWWWILLPLGAGALVAAF